MRLLLNLLIIFTTYSCAAKKIFVKNADTFINYQLDKRLHLNASQKKELERDVDQLLNSSKPLALELKRVTENIDVSSLKNIDEKFKKVELITKKISEEISIILSRYMSQLDRNQQLLFFEGLKSENEDIASKSEDERWEETSDRVESFIGDIKGDQQKVLNEFREYFELRSRSRLSRRIALHEKFKLIYAQSISIEARKNLFQEAFLQYQKESFEQNRTLEFLQRILPNLDTDQKKHFMEKISDVKEIIDIYLDTQY